MSRSDFVTIPFLLIAWFACGTVTLTGADERRGSPLHGTVSLPEGERPENVFVIVSGFNFYRSTTAHTDGTFVFSNVPDGDYSVEVRASGYLSTQTPIRAWSAHYPHEIVVPLGRSTDQTPLHTGAPVISVEKLRIPEKALKEAQRGAKEKDNLRFDRAIGHYRKAVEIYPEYMEAWNNLGTVYFRIGKTAEAEEAYQRAIRLKPDASPALRNLGFLYLKTDDSAKAIPLLVQACEAAQHNDVFAETYLGFALYQERRFTEAEACLQKAVALQDDFVAALYQQGFVKTQLGKYDEARALFNRVLTLGAPDNEIIQIKQVLAQLDRLRGDEQR
jgi:tetratricopeptide (TPR) repeat protein